MMRYYAADYANYRIYVNALAIAVCIFYWHMGQPIAVLSKVSERWSLDFVSDNGTEMTSNALLKWQTYI